MWFCLGRMTPRRSDWVAALPRRGRSLGTWFHVEPLWIRAAEYAQLDLDGAQIDRLTTYREWLIEEGITAGGIGPGEASRVDRRHIADSLLFATQLGGIDEVWDLGTGVGLPGIPLAIGLPGTHFRLIDRSGRRIDLLRRVLRILELENCQVALGEIADLEGTTSAMVSRAGLPPTELTPVVEQHLQPGGIAVVGGSWLMEPDQPGWTAIEIPPEVLDQPVWLLIMRRQ